MFRFEHIEYLFLLLIVPLLAGAYVLAIYLRNRDLRRLGDVNLLSHLIPDFSQFRLNAKFFIRLLVMVLVIFALAGPQFGSKLVQIKREGIEIIVALDVSNSMMAEDVKPNRLERAKQELSRLMDKLENDRLGLIVFAGNAYTQIPITNDYLSAKMFLAAINPGMISRQGTAIGSAIDLAERSFSAETKASKAIIIISDGENHEGDALEKSREAAEKGIKVFTIGMGLPQGVRIPLNSGPYNRDFRRDKDGNFVITRLNEQMLTDIASVGNGKYYRANAPGMGLNEMLSELNKLDKTEMEFREYSDFSEQFPVLIWIALGLLVLDFLILEKKNRWSRKIRLFN
jgi:Ca-activated chloride channel family protein